MIYLKNCWVGVKQQSPKTQIECKKKVCVHMTQLPLNYEKAMFGVTDNNFQQVKKPTKIT